MTCRFTHVYPDGPAPYYTVLAPGRRGEELEQWAHIKAAAADAILDAGGTITHHHAVGRDHRPWYDRQRPEPFATALRGAKAALDPDRGAQPRGPDRLSGSRTWPSRAASTAGADGASSGVSRRSSSSHPGWTSMAARTWARRRPMSPDLRSPEAGPEAQLV